MTSDTVKFHMDFYQDLSGYVNNLFRWDTIVLPTGGFMLDGHAWLFNGDHWVFRLDYKGEVTIAPGMT